MLGISFLIHKNTDDVDFGFLLASVSISVCILTLKPPENPLLLLAFKLLRSAQKWDKDDFLSHDVKLQTEKFCLHSHK